MENYTLGLALFDYLPVIAAGFGLYLICKYCGLLANYQGRWIILIPAIALTGGVLKASWKLIYALIAVDNRWMSDQLFFFLATSYVLMATFVIVSFRMAARRGTLRPDWWYLPAIVAAVLVIVAFYLRLNAEGRTWSIVLLATLSVANFMMLITLIGHALKRRNWIAGAAFATNLVLSYVLVGLARIPEQTAELQWIEEMLNLANNSMLAVGAWALLRAMRRSTNTFTTPT